MKGESTVENAGQSINRSPMIGDTVAAISTPYGKGGVALIRISGSDAVAVGGRIFAPACKKPLEELPSNRAAYGEILYNGEKIDDGLVTVFRAPRSFTGEDVVEISCHGGILLAQKVLESALVCGASPAGPGEFSKRAFLNGKMTLTEAEAVIDLINAENGAQLRVAAKQSAGALSARIDRLYEQLCALLSTVYVYIDYPDEDLTDLSDEEFAARLSALRGETERLCESYRFGHAVMEGIPTVIVGRPNTGKSSLLNQLLGRDRAIVSPVAGTTRDTVEETVTLGEITLRLCDTAGIRETNDTVERIGVQRSLEKLGKAELILAVFDGSAEATDEDRALISQLEECAGREVPVLAMVNKSDLAQKFDLSLLSGFPSLTFSAREKEPPQALYAFLSKEFAAGAVGYDADGMLTNARQAAAAEGALSALRRAEEALRCGMSKDVAGMDVEEAMERLKDIDGRSVGEDIVSSIFHRFCVGK